MLGQGTVGTAVQEQRSILLNDVSEDPRYISIVPGVQSTLVVPLRHKGKAIGALNLLSNEKNAFDDTDESMLRAFGAVGRAGHRERAALRVGTRVLRHDGDAGRGRP